MFPQPVSCVVEKIREPPESAFEFTKSWRILLQTRNPCSQARDVLIRGVLVGLNGLLLCGHGTNNKTYCPGKHKCWSSFLLRVGVARATATQTTRSLKSIEELSAFNIIRYNSLVAWMLVKNSCETMHSEHTPLSEISGHRQS